MAVQRLLCLALVVGAYLVSDSALARGGARGGSHGAKSGGHNGARHLGAPRGGHHFAAPRFTGRHFSRAPLGIGFIGVPLFFPPPPVYYYPPPAVLVPSATPQYIEQGTSGSAGAYWYYCADSQTYYPYVNECASGWQPVSPEPAAQPGTPYSPRG
jgi:hypothetical protein